MQLSGKIIGRIRERNTRACSAGDRGGEDLRGAGPELARPGRDGVGVQARKEELACKTEAEWAGKSEEQAAANFLQGGGQH